MATDHDHSSVRVLEHLMAEDDLYEFYCHLVSILFLSIDLLNQERLQHSLKLLIFDGLQEYFCDPRMKF